MHEAALMQAVVRHVAGLADGAVRTVHLRVGALVHGSDRHLRTHYELAVHGTPLSGSDLVIDRSPDPTDPNALHVVVTAIDVEDG